MPVGKNSRSLVSMKRIIRKGELPKDPEVITVRPVYRRQVSPEDSQVYYHHPQIPSGEDMSTSIARTAVKFVALSPLRVCIGIMIIKRVNLGVCSAELVTSDWDIMNVGKPGKSLRKTTSSD